MVISAESFKPESALFSVISEERDGENIIIRLQGDESTANSEIIREVAAQYEILSFEEELPTMNDIFIQIVSNTTAQ